MPEPLSTKIVCPKCHTFWATASVKFNAILRSKDVIIEEAWRHRHFGNDFLVCPKCNHQLTRHELFVCIARSMKNSDPTWSGLRTHGMS